VKDIAEAGGKSYTFHIEALKDPGQARSPEQSACNSGPALMHSRFNLVQNPRQS
jgi:hypothetical protein